MPVEITTPIVKVQMVAEVASATVGYQIIDPTNFTADDLPLFVFVDDRTSLIGWLIKWHTRGEYNHVMMMHKPGMLVSQDFAGYREVPLKNYLKKNILLKFFSYDGIRPDQKEYIYKDIDAQLKENSFKKGYDWLGIFGQAIGCPWIHSPWRKYCSTRVTKIARDLSIPVPDDQNPSQLNTLFHTKMPPLRVKGYWLAG